MCRRILAVFAHPDDETYGPAAALTAASRHHDTRVRLLIATRGEAGSLGISRNYSRADLARIRQWEMIQSARTMGAELGILGYPDGGLSDLPEEELLGKLVEEIRAFRPHVLVTFHPNGLSGHPDHCCLGRLLGVAGWLAGDPIHAPGRRRHWQATRLWYFALSEARAELIAPRRRVNSVPAEDIDRTIDATPWLRIKHRLARQHETQFEFFRFLDGIPGGIDAYWSREDYVLGATYSDTISDCKDLFYGIDT